MYDGTFSNTTNGCNETESGCGLMDLYDVGMSSLFVQEAYALAELAPHAGRPQSLVNELNARGQSMAAKISVHLWDDSLSIFVNRFSANNSFYAHVPALLNLSLFVDAHSTLIQQRESCACDSRFTHYAKGLFAGAGQPHIVLRARSEVCD